MSLRRFGRCGSQMAPAIAANCMVEYFADAYAFAASAYLTLGPVFGPTPHLVYGGEPSKNPSPSLSAAHTLLAIACSAFAALRAAWLSRPCVGALALGALWAHSLCNRHWVWDPIEVSCAVLALLSYLAVHCLRGWAKRWLLALLSVLVLSRAGWLRSAHTLTTAAALVDMAPLEALLTTPRPAVCAKLAAVTSPGRHLLAHKTINCRYTLHAALSCSSAGFVAALVVKLRGRSCYTVPKGLARHSYDLQHRP
jgi:hypothetical protein